MRLLTLPRLQAYAKAMAEYDRAEAAGDVQLANLIYDGPVKWAAARLPVTARAWLDDTLPRLAVDEEVGPG